LELENKLIIFKQAKSRIFSPFISFIGVMFCVMRRVHVHYYYLMRKTSSRIIESSDSRSAGTDL
jgi:purine-cytosine permease-like protein